jgi:hypothetical protein
VAADPEAFESKRKELLAKAQNLFKLTSTVLKGKVDTTKKYEKAQEHERMVEEEYERAVELAEQWATHIKETQEEAKQNKTRWRDAPLVTSTLTAQLATNLWKLQKITWKRQRSSWPTTMARLILTTSRQSLVLP